MAELEDGFVYYIDIPPPSGGPPLDPDTYVLGSIGTEGTDYIKIEIPKRIQDAYNTNKIAFPLPGSGLVTAFGYNNQKVMVSGEVMENTIAANMTRIGLIKKFVATKYKDTGDLYLVIRFASGVYWPFIEGTTVTQYSKGTFVNPDCMIQMNNGNGFKQFVNIAWFEVW